MTLQEAIEILSQWDKGTDPLYLPDLPDALKLGIEAMKAWQEHRRIMGHPKLWILPGETEE